jgi:hypothetical protein
MWACSVADPGCLSRVLILSIPDSGCNNNVAIKEEGEIKICSTSFYSHKYHKIENHFIFEQVKKKVRASLQKIVAKICVWDPVSGKNLFRIHNTVGLELIMEII